MTLLPMENRESILCALKCFSKEKPSNIPSILEEYIQNISRNGQTILPWVYVKPLILHKYNVVVECFTVDAMSIETEELRLRVLGVLKRLDGIPFTIQRICELLCGPTRQYSHLDKYLRGLEKVCRVVSTVDPRGNKIHHEDPRFPSQAGLEECMVDDGMLSPTTSPSDGDEVTDEDGDNGSSSGIDQLQESSDILSSGMDSHLPARSSPSWRISSDADAVSLGNEAGDTLMTSPPSDEIERPLLRPIGQLEAFVQNIAADIPSSISTSPTTVTSTTSSSNTKTFSLKLPSFSSDQDEVRDVEMSDCELEVDEQETDRIVTDMPMERSSDEHTTSNEHELEPPKPLTGVKRRASISVDKSETSSFESKIPTDELVCEKNSPLECDEKEDHQAAEDSLAHKSPAKRRRFAASQEDNSSILLSETAGCSNTVADSQKSTSAASATTMTLNGSPPIIICNRPGGALSLPVETPLSDILIFATDADPHKVDDESSPDAAGHEDIAQPESPDNQSSDCGKETSVDSPDQAHST